MIATLKKLKALMPALHARNYAALINVTEEYIDYTDGFSLIRLKNRTKLLGQYTKDQLNKFLVADVNEPNKPNDYPKIDAVIPDDTAYHSVELNGKILADLLGVLTRESKDKIVELRFKDNHSVVTIRIDGHLALLVPITRD